MYKALFEIKEQEILRLFFANSEKKKPFKHVCDGAYCPITWA